MRVCLLLLALVAATSAQLVIESSERDIDGSGFAIPVQTMLKIRNDGRSAAAGIVLCEPEEVASHRAVKEVLVDGDMNTRLKSKPVSPERAEGATCEEWALPAPLGTGKSIKLAVVSVYTGVLTPKPASIPPTEPQRVVFEAPLYLLSPYLVESQSTIFKASSDSIDELSEGGVKKGRTVSYGPYEKVAPWSAAGEPLRVLYENNSPFAQASSVERDIEISHWGNVYFEDRYTIRNAGAKVSGEWSRMDYMTRPNFGRSAIREFTAVVPAAAHSLYFRDEIGNMSSSAARFSLNEVTVQLAPRYPLFGGWVSTFKFGWSLPLASALGSLPSGKMVLKTPLGPAVRGLVADELTIRVVLPEGATGVDVSVPVPMEQTVEREYTYLDVMGRTVVVLRARNYVPQQTSIQIEYAYSSIGLLQKPVLLVAALGSLFGLVFVLSWSSSSGGIDIKDKTA